MPYSSPTKTQRWLDLIAVLLGRRYPLAIEDLLTHAPAYRTELERAEAAPPEDRDRQLASLRRKFERDKKELRRLGIPLLTEPMRLDSGEMGEGYRIPSASFYLPLLRVMQEGVSPGAGAGSRGVRTVELTEGEAATALAALRRILALPAFPFDREARTALRKITFDLDPSLGEGHAVRVLERAGGADPGRHLPLLMEALLERKRVGFAYRRGGAPAGSGEAGSPPRQVEPWGLFFQWGGWYLLGHDPERDPPLRLYRVDRMEDPLKNRQRPGTPDFARDPSFRIGAWMEREAWELSGPDAVTEVIEVRFRPPLELLAERNGWGEAATDPGHRHFQVRRRGPFLRWILSQGGDAEVVAPAEAARELAEMAERIRVRHAPPADPGGAA
jgi:proteasome accessory factor B